MGLLLILPLIGLILFFAIPDAKWAGRLNILFSVVELVQILILVPAVALRGPMYFFGQTVYLDGLNALQLLMIGVIGLMVAIYSYRYVADRADAGRFTRFQVRLYYFLFNCFVLSMLLMAVLNNLGLMWIALEATTLSTAFFIGFTRTKASLEAAWKYIIICTLGIGLGLLGIALLIYGVYNGEGSIQLSTVDWTVLLGHAAQINNKVAAVAFAIILIGFGTKVGLAPMHTWLPDAYSESPSPISAMMSGLLGSLAFYGILRFYAIVKRTMDLELLQILFIGFGIVSLIVAGASILRQKNYKRMFAYSSVENMGIIALGIGFGGNGIFFALFHMLMQALSKTLLFFVAGNMLHVYRTREIEQVRGMFRRMPVNAFFLLVGMLAVVGMPPFASFVSEFGILRAGVESGHWGAVTVLGVVLLIVFAGFVVHFSRMLYDRDESVTAAADTGIALSFQEAASAGGEFLPAAGQGRGGQAPLNGPARMAEICGTQSVQTVLTDQSADLALMRDLASDRLNILAPALVALIIVGISIYVPDFLQEILHQAAAIIG